MDEILGIGEFAIRSGLSAKRLRSYASAGLLVPAAVDSNSGYRYYSVGQLQRARLISLLRQAGIAVADIAEFLTQPGLETVVRWDRQLVSELSVRRHALAQVRQVLALQEPTSPQPQPLEGARPTMNLAFDAGSATDKGGRDMNQDSALIGDCLFAVADGLGGGEQGEVASRLALEVLDATYSADRSRAGLLVGCTEANRVVWRESQSAGRDRVMGTTIAAVGVDGNGEVTVVHVGDSRLYRLREGQLAQLTHDHSVTADLIRSGQITEAEAAVHPHRLVLTRAVGVDAEVEVDITEAPCRPNDRLLLCTDGLIKALNRDQMAIALGENADPRDTAKRLVTEAVANEAEDNVTALVIDVH